MDRIRPAATRVRRATTAVLPAGLGAVVRTRAGAIVPSFDILVQAHKGTHRFFGVWAGEGWPRDVERTVGLAPDADVVFARRISPGAREWLESRHVG